MKSLTSSLLAAGFLAASASADRIGLTDGNLVTGKVSTIDDQQRLVVESPNFSTPLVLRNTALSSIDFDFAPPDIPPHQERLHLTNGDVLPGVVRGMDTDHIDFHTWFAGDLQVPRDAVLSIDFGVAPQELAFKGPGGPDGWLDNDEWKFRGTTLCSVGRGTIARPKVLPEQFILRFHLAWETKPAFRFYFCDDHLQTGGEADRYFFDIGTGGMVLKRQARNQGSTGRTVYSSLRRPDEFPDKNVEIEFRVDRKNNLFHIYVDGESEGHFSDPIGQIPTGSGIMLASTSSGQVKNVVLSIEVYKWDAVSQLHRSEGHEDPTRDAVITTDSERLGGKVQGMVDENGERILLLRTPHADDLLHVPLRRTSVLYLRQVEAPSSQPGSFLVELAGQGRIQLVGLTLDNQSLAGQHTLLGPVTLQRKALVRLHTDSPEAGAQ